MTEEVLIRISLSDDIPSRHPDNTLGQDLVFWVLRSMHAKNGTDHSKSRNAPKIIGGRKAGKFIPGRRAG